MATRVLIVLVAFAFISCVSVQGTVHWRMRNLMETERRQRLYEHIQEKYKGNPPIPEPKFLEQPLDHFTQTPGQKTLPQRYYVNEKFWKRPNGPVFLYIGGEGTQSPYAALGGEHVDLAEKYGALVFVVEHRFYGASINKDGLELDQLKYLSSQQELADLANFYEHATEMYKLTSNNTWICFGGSYAGNLAAWFRLKYPHIVYGAVASSAPVLAVEDFYGYNQVVAKSLSDPVVGGSEKCLQAIEDGFYALSVKLSDHKIQEVIADFKSCGSTLQGDDVTQLIDNLMDPFANTVQYNLQGSAFDIASICRNMTKSTDAYQNLVDFSALVLKISGEPCLDNSYSKFIKSLQNTTVDLKAFGVGIRQWLYQTCTQFGYYSSCEPGRKCPFMNDVSFKFEAGVCPEVFNISISDVKQYVAFTNAYYGGEKPQSTRIIFPNGSIDPWHYLSVLKNIGTSEIAIFIHGTSHCANMGSPRKSDPPSLTSARQKISNIVGKWLEGTRVGSH